MRKTFSGLITLAQDGANDTSTAIKTFLKRRINERYEICTDKLNTFTQTAYKTYDSEVDKQYYDNPVNLRDIETVKVDIGSVELTLTPVNSQSEWDRLNSIQFQGGALPEKYFRRKDDFGIYPIPQSADYDITIAYTQRAMPLYFEDYTTGTVAVTNNNATVTVTTGNFTVGNIKAGFWFTLADTDGEPRGSWYRIDSVTDATHLELEIAFSEATETGAKYIIGQSPEIPEEGHTLPAFGAIADFYMLKQKDIEAATRFNNTFWTGNPNVVPNMAKKDEDLGGLLGLITAYKDRDTSVIVEHKVEGSYELNKEWATHIS